ncbi:MAG: tetratricopeptide repeat protein, partial [Bacteroidetes bacterium]|nr:tetratricopeptide repeat protein [Bacteroidota bacterium]
PLKINKVRISVLITPLISLSMFSVIVSLYRYSGEYHTNKLYNAHKTANWDKMIDEADKAINCCYRMDPMSVPVEWYKGVALFTTGYIPQATRSFEFACRINPFNIHILNNLASCYEKTGEHKKAEELYLKVLSISSSFEETLLNLSAVYYNSCEFDKAYKMIDKCDIGSADSKYQSFLPVILDAKVDLIIADRNDTDVINKLTRYKNKKGEIVKLYFESKRKHINFEEYLVNIK